MKTSSSGAAHDLILVISDLGSGGAQRMLVRLCQAWLAQGLRLCVVTLAPADSDFFTLDSRITRIALDATGQSTSTASGLLANLSRVFSLRGALGKIDAPIVVSFIGTTNILAVLAGFGLGRRIVACERNDPRRQSLGSPLWDRLRRWCYPLADVVTANSQDALDGMKAFVPAHKLAYVPNLPPPPQPLAESQAASATILSVGRLNQQKGHDVLLQAFAVLADRHPDWRLCIVGEGELRLSLEQLIDKLGLIDRVSLVGRTDDPFAYYRAAAIFVLASRHEGMPNVVLEAMSCGLPVVVSDGTGGALDYVSDGTNGVVVPRDDAGALVNALDRLIRDPALRARLGARARQRLENSDTDQLMMVWNNAIGLNVGKTA